MFRTLKSQTPAADHRPQRASHHGHLTDPDKEPTMAIVCSSPTKTVAEQKSVTYFSHHRAAARFFHCSRAAL